MNTISRIETGDVQFNYTHTNLALLVEEAYLFERAALGDYRVKFESAYGAEIKVYIDEARLMHTLCELLTSAAKFTGDEKLCMRICDAGKDGRVRIEISDFGRGIAEDDLDNIFDALSQANDLYGATHNEIGSGLALSKCIANEMSVDLGVSSRTGMGTTFGLELSLSA